MSHCGLPTFVVHGTSRRVQIKVFDWSDAPPNMPDGKGGLQRDRPTKFLVQVLSKDKHQYTAYSKGLTLYFGTDFDRAWGEVRRHTGNPKMPEGLVGYWLRSEEKEAVR